MTDSTTASGSHGDADAEAHADGHLAPRPERRRAGRHAVTGADPDIATSPAETDVDASPEGDVGAHDPDGTARA